MKYGSREVPLVLAEKSVLLSHREPPVNIDTARFRDLLSSNLPDSHKKASDVGIVVADKTRLCQYPIYLPVLTGYLLDSGMEASCITFHIAYGTHEAQSDLECIDSYGESYRQFRFLHHHSKNKDGFSTLGITSRGTSVRVSKTVLQHDLLISFGAVLHHYFAGFGGGRKLIFPGLAAYDSILQNHSLFMDFRAQTLERRCQPGRLDDNPLAMDLEEIDSLLPRRLELHAILNSKKEVCDIFAGSAYRDFREVCRHYDSYFRSTDERQFDLLIASAGGFPRDINFIQAHKSIHNAASFVKNGGKLVIFAECRDGLGNPGFMDMLRLGGYRQIFEGLEGTFRNNAGTALSMLEKSNRINILLVTSLSKEECEMMGAEKSSPEDVQRIIIAEKGSTAVLENAAMIYN